MHRAFLLGSASAFILGLSAAQAFANSNEVYLGQTGVTNSVTIEQAGDGNLIGAEDTTLRVSQDGNNNSLNATQTGFANQLGANSIAGPLGLQGVQQIGDQNVISVSQSNSTSGGWNLIGAILQSAPTSLATGPSNSLTITQTDTSALGGSGSGDGKATHQIGDIRQIQTGFNANIATIAQYDGTSGNGDGNQLDAFQQDGSGNQATINQQEDGNQITSFNQYGDNNEATIYQRNGNGNQLVSFHQDGASNRASVSMTGSRNLLFSLLQNNALVGIVGNITTATLGGDDNGGDGMGGLGQFTANVTRQLQVAQAEIHQFGDENLLNFVTAASSSTNLYGFVQDGDGNVISGTIDGSENEVAALQIGDGNRLDFSQIGETNIVAITARGDDNSLSLEQNGDDNSIDIAFDGATNPITRSNQNNDPALGGFTGLAATHDQGLLPGQVLQSGAQNSLQLAVNYGNANKFATNQTGNSNSIEGMTTGNENQVIVQQMSDFNRATFRQRGHYNLAIILQ